MKNAIKLFAAAATLFSYAEAVRADPVDQVLGWLGQKGASSLCRKGDAKKGVFSLRSFEGDLCKTTYIAALAEAVCATPNTEDYKGSHCHKYAVAALKGRDPGRRAERGREERRRQGKRIRLRAARSSGGR